MNKLGQGFNTAEQDLDPDALSRESDALPLSHCALECECVNEFFSFDVFVFAARSPITLYVKYTFNFYNWRFVFL